ncbi:MAG: DUF5677 domain-containing protein [Nitrospira sp.]|nr:DUF5677 domain-containing protein [Nitrospira sp.]
MSLSQSLGRAKQFGIWLHERTNDRERPGGVRNRTAESIFQQSLDCNDGIIILLEHHLPGAAWALARPLFEGYARGFWLLKFATDDQIEHFNNGQGPGMDQLLKDISNDPTTGGAWIHETQRRNRKSFNNLTHGGSEHVSRRNTEDAVEPNYPESELEALVNFGIEVRILIGAELLSLMNDEVGMQELAKEAETLRRSFKP